MDRTWGAEAAAREADALLRNPAIEHAFVALEDGLVEGWKQSKPEEYALRESLYHQWLGLKTLKQELTRALTPGKIANARRAQVDYRRSLEHTNVIPAVPGPAPHL